MSKVKNHLSDTSRGYHGWKSPPSSSHCRPAQPQYLVPDLYKSGRHSYCIYYLDIFNFLEYIGRHRLEKDLDFCRHHDVLLVEAFLSLPRSSFWTSLPRGLIFKSFPRDYIIMRFNLHEVQSSQGSIFTRFDLHKVQSSRASHKVWLSRVFQEVLHKVCSSLGSFSTRFVLHKVHSSQDSLFTRLILYELRSSRVSSLSWSYEFPKRVSS